MQISTALKWAIPQLSDSPTPILDAELLLCHVLQKGRTYLIAFDDEVLPAAQIATFRQLIAEASQHVPIPYLVGHAPFFGRDFRVSPAVLIPRPETEELVTLALDWLRENRGRNVVDVGTGSGCIAVTVASEDLLAQVEAVDVSLEALGVARENAGIFLPTPRTITFHHGNLLNPITHPIDLIIANLPYIDEAEWQTLPPHVRQHEPKIALTAPRQGTALIEQLLQQATQKLAPHGAIMLEHGWQQGQAILALAHHYFPKATVELKKDLAGNDRIVVVQTP